MGVHQHKIGTSLKKLKPIEKEELESKQILLATTKIMEEGVDIKALDTIILATPKKKVVQSCGRILRRLKHEYENIPLMIDIVDQIGMFNGMARKRMMQYKEKYLISSGNVVYLENVETIKIMIDKINLMSKDELKDYDAFIVTYPPPFSLLYKHFDKPIIINNPIVNERKIKSAP